MPKWDIEPGGVNHVLSRVNDALGALERHVGGYGEDLGGAAKCSGALISGEVGGGGQSPVRGLVASALVEFVEGTAEEVRFIGTRAGQSINGARLATAAYEMGDLEMAAELQHRANSVIDPFLERPTPLGQGLL
ncbi:ESX-1 secretion-associated protein OS=Streptomyces alboniger OX=132473 GN=CP975_10235 PE=4 SV=1 [Streptomyces alboniger]